MGVEKMSKILEKELKLQTDCPWCGSEDLDTEDNIQYCEECDWEMDITEYNEWLENTTRESDERKYSNQLIFIGDFIGNAQSFYADIDEKMVNTQAVFDFIMEKFFSNLKKDSFDYEQFSEGCRESLVCECKGKFKQLKRKERNNPDLTFYICLTCGTVFAIH